MTAWVLLQSGFITPKHPRLRKSEGPSPVDRIAAARYGGINREELLIEDNNYYDPMVMSLVNEYYQNPELSNNFDFIERIIRVTKTVFQTGFWNWLKIQNAAPTLTNLHNEFIIETLDFLNGKRRLITSTSWEVLIRYHNQSEFDRRRYLFLDQYMKDHTLNQDSEQRKSQPDVVPIIQAWLSQESGIPDLIMTLSIIFREKT